MSTEPSYVGIDLMEYSEVFICNEVLGFASNITLPCDCGNPHCAQRFGHTTWTVRNGTDNNFTIRSIKLMGNDSQERAGFLLQLLNDILLINGRHVTAGLTMHFTNIGDVVGGMEECLKALRNAKPPVDDHWIKLIECEVLDEAFAEMRERGVERLS